MWTVSPDDVHNSVKAIVPYTCRETFKLFTGLSDGYCYTSDEVSYILKTSPEAVERFFAEACGSFCTNLAKCVSFPRRPIIDSDIAPTLSNRLTSLARRHFASDLVKMTDNQLDQLLQAYSSDLPGDDVVRIGWRRLDGGDLIVLPASESELASDIFLTLQRSERQIAVALTGHLAAVYVRPHREFCDFLNVVGIFFRGNPTERFEIAVTSSQTHTRLSNWLSQRGIPTDAADFLLVNSNKAP